MSSPVDLTNLREITDGDTQMENELFREFLSASDSYVVGLASLTSANQNEEWRKTAHAFKGISFNLGANHLGELCKKAQENNTASEQEKLAMLDDIRKEYNEVRDFLGGMLG